MLDTSSVCQWKRRFFSPCIYCYNADWISVREDMGVTKTSSTIKPPHFIASLCLNGGNIVSRVPKYNWWCWIYDFMIFTWVTRLPDNRKSFMCQWQHCAEVTGTLRRLKSPVTGLLSAALLGKHKKSSTFYITDGFLSQKRPVMRETVPCPDVFMAFTWMV